MEVIIYNQIKLVDGRMSVVYLIRSNAEVKMNSVLLPEGTDAQVYGDMNAASLFAGGNTPDFKVSPIALFQATKNKESESIHMGAIYAAFQQLQMGGSVSDMKVAAKQIYSTNDTQLAALLAFINSFKNGSDSDKEELIAIALYASSSLVTL